MNIEQRVMELAIEVLRSRVGWVVEGWKYYLVFGVAFIVCVFAVFGAVMLVWVTWDLWPRLFHDNVWMTWKKVKPW